MSLVAIVRTWLVASGFLLVLSAPTHAETTLGECIDWSRFDEVLKDAPQEPVSFASVIAEMEALAVGETDIHARYASYKRGRDALLRDEAIPRGLPYLDKAEETLLQVPMPRFIWNTDTIFLAAEYLEFGQQEKFHRLIQTMENFAWITAIVDSKTAFRELIKTLIDAKKFEEAYRLTDKIAGRYPDIARSLATQVQAQHAKASFEAGEYSLAKELAMAASSSTEQSNLRTEQYQLATAASLLSQNSDDAFVQSLKEHFELAADDEVLRIQEARDQFSKIRGTKSKSVQSNAIESRNYLVGWSFLHAAEDFADVGLEETSLEFLEQAEQYFSQSSQKKVHLIKRAQVLSSLGRNRDVREVLDAIIARELYQIADQSGAISLFDPNLLKLVMKHGDTSQLTQIIYLMEDSAFETKPVLGWLSEHYLRERDADSACLFINRFTFSAPKQRQPNTAMTKKHGEGYISIERRIVRPLGEEFAPWVDTTSQMALALQEEGNQKQAENALRLARAFVDLAPDHNVESRLATVAIAAYNAGFIE